VGRMRGKRVLGRLLDDLTVRSRCVGMQAAEAFQLAKGGRDPGSAPVIGLSALTVVFVVTGVLDSNQSVSGLLHQIWEKAAVANGEEEEVRCQEKRPVSE